MPEPLGKALDLVVAVWQKDGMKLQAYLDHHEMKPARFAAELGVPASTVTRLLRGEREPGIKLMKRIADATGGAVTPNDFLPSTDEPERPFETRGAA